ncbi:hypothetical protein Bbelb_202580 [Branchiostoma belcheri]|nr:hypothetical protein Bbelb_202580 [Branchiostoma belcheri]
MKESVQHVVVGFCVGAVSVGVAVAVAHRLRWVHFSAVKSGTNHKPEPERGPQRSGTEGEATRPAAIQADDVLSRESAQALNEARETILTLRALGGADQVAEDVGGSSINYAESQNILNLLYNIAEDQARKEGYVHRGITCNICNTSPVCGTRYKCGNCVDYDVCERCEPLDIHDKSHMFIKITIPLPPLASPRAALFKPLFTGSTARDHSLQPISWSHVKRLQKITHFDHFELEALYEQYRCLCDQDAVIKRDTFNFCLGPLGTLNNLVLDRLWQFYDFNDDGVIDFDDFAKGLSVLVKGTQEEKARFAFQGYDIEKKNSLSRENLTKLLKAYFQVSIELVRDVVKACEEEMMLNFDDSQGKPVSSLFNAPIPSTTGQQGRTANGKPPIPGNPGATKNMWPVMEAMSQDAIEEMVDNVFKDAKLEAGDRMSYQAFKELSTIDSSLMSWFDALGTVF